MPSVVSSGIFCYFHGQLCVFYACLKDLMELFPLCRGRYNVELHLSFLRLQGQANDFKIQYSSVVRLFLLPKVLIFLIRLQGFRLLHELFSFCMVEDKL